MPKVVSGNVGFIPNDSTKQIWRRYMQLHGPEPIFKIFYTSLCKKKKIDSEKRFEKI